METQAERHGRSAFAEAAEAVGIPTDQVMMHYHDEQGDLIVYSEEFQGDSTCMFRVRLKRGGDGILRVASDAQYLGTFGSFKDDVEEKLKRLAQ